MLPNKIINLEALSFDKEGNIVDELGRIVNVKYPSLWRRSECLYNG